SPISVSSCAGWQGIATIEKLLNQTLTHICCSSWVMMFLFCASSFKSSRYYRSVNGEAKPSAVIAW
ncbi:hypothetical protein, partial [Hoeflea sp.]|uniref:hypothetical protein n=1 Tax=Hoeflea sp. TaxID=1940281 RepID=UPI003A94ED03